MPKARKLMSLKNIFVAICHQIAVEKSHKSVSRVFVKTIIAGSIGRNELSPKGGWALSHL